MTTGATSPVEVTSRSSRVRLAGSQPWVLGLLWDKPLSIVPVEARLSGVDLVWLDKIADDKVDDNVDDVRKLRVRGACTLNTLCARLLLRVGGDFSFGVDVDSISFFRR